MYKLGFKILELKIKKEELYLSDELEINSKSYKDFLSKFLMLYNKQSHTYFNDNSIQTESGKRRSLGDIYNICKTYYEDITLKRVITELYRLCNNTQGFRTSYCYLIQKRVFYYDYFANNAILNDNIKDEYGYTIPYYIKRITL